MHLVKKIGAASFVLAAVLLLTACPSETTISKINADPARYRNKEVAIVGTVRDSYGAMGQGAYEIDDGTGEMRPVTSLSEHDEQNVVALPAERTREMLRRVDSSLNGSLPGSETSRL